MKEIGEKNMKLLTKKQQDVLQYICKHIHETNLSPSIREIGDAMGLSSPATVKHYIDKLVEQDYISVEDGKTRSIRLKGKWFLKYHVPIVKSWETKLPQVPKYLHELEHLVEEFTIYPNTDWQEALFAITIHQDKLTNQGILPGDFVILRGLAPDFVPSASNKLFLVKQGEENALAQMEETQLFFPELNQRISPESVTFLAEAVGVQRNYHE